MAKPASFIAISEGMSGPVTFAAMDDGRLAVEFVISTHLGETHGEYTGTVDANGLFVGNGVITDEIGQIREAEVTMTFRDDGAIATEFGDDPHTSGFVPTDMFWGF